MKVEVTIVGTLNREPGDTAALKALPAPEVAQALIEEESDITVAFRDLE